jgi:hypothetical protein
MRNLFWYISTEKKLQTQFFLDLFLIMSLRLDFIWIINILKLGN